MYKQHWVQYLALNESLEKSADAVNKTVCANPTII